jgi:FG-GAP repeat
MPENSCNRFRVISFPPTASPTQSPSTAATTFSPTVVTLSPATTSPRALPTASPWIQLGTDINGASGDWFGHDVAISADGNRVAVSARFYNDGLGPDSGYVRVLDWNEAASTWDQYGLDINGVAANDRFGYSIAMSADGTRIAVTAPNADGGDSAWEPVASRLVLSWCSMNPLPLALHGFKSAMR